MAKKLIELKGIKKSYGDNTILHDLNMSINENEFVTFLGPSGCGKTTTLRIIGGFETMNDGELYLDGEKIHDLPSHKRPINTVFQRYSLFPHYSIFDNVAFGLRHNIYSSVYDIGVKSLMIENNFDELTIDEIWKHLNKILKPKDVKKEIIKIFSEKSIVCNYEKEFKSLKKDIVSLNELHCKYASSYNIDLENNIKVDNVKIKDILKQNDVYFEMIEKICSKKFKEEVILKEVTESLKLVNLAGYENRLVSQLSGGQMQRVAIARAIVNKPRILLLDEPLAALDLKLRQAMRFELKEMQQNIGITFIFVTHDQEEAMVMSDTVVVMNGGEIQQVGRPEDIYNSPINRFVADFIGESNIIRGKYLGGSRLEMLGKVFKVSVNDFKPNDKVHIIVEKEDLDIVPLESAAITGEVLSVAFRRSHYLIEVLINGAKIMVNTQDRYQVGDILGFTIDPNNIYIENFKETKEALLANYNGDNILEGVFIEENTVSFLGAEFETYIETFSPNELVDAVIRPEDFDLELVNPDDAILQGKVISSVFTGVHFQIRVDLDGVEVVVHDYQNVEVGTIIGLRVDFYEIHIMKASNEEI